MKRTIFYRKAKYEIEIDNNATFCTITKTTKESKLTAHTSDIGYYFFTDCITELQHKSMFIDARQGLAKLFNPQN
ncbi:MAG: hypothetical protein WCI57_04945 [Candidatus Berkelbacteria bacterium]